LKRKAWAFSAIHFPAVQHYLSFFKEKKERIVADIGAI
jgi:hypothetical protein